MPSNILAVGRNTIQSKSLNFGFRPRCVARIHRDRKKRPRAGAGPCLFWSELLPLLVGRIKNEGDLCARPWSALSLRPLMLSTVFVEFLAEPQLPGCIHILDRSVPVWASAAAHKLWSYWFEPPRAMRVTATCSRGGGKTRRRLSRRREQDLRRGIAAAAAARLHRVPSLLRSPFLPLPSTVVPEESETCGEAATSSGWGSLECERRFSGEGREPGVEEEVRGLRRKVFPARAGERALVPAFNLASLPDPPRGTACSAVASGADREGPGSALLSTAVCSAWCPPPVSPLPARGPEPSLSSFPFTCSCPFLRAHRETLPSLSSFLSLSLVLGISLVAGFEWVLLGTTFIVPGVGRFSLPFLWWRSRQPTWDSTLGPCFPSPVWLSSVTVCFF